MANAGIPLHAPQGLPCPRQVAEVTRVASNQGPAGVKNSRLPRYLLVELFYSPSVFFEIATRVGARSILPAAFSASQQNNGPKALNDCTMLHVAHKWARLPAAALAIDTTLKTGLWSELSPFLLAGGELYGGHTSVNMENAWQFSKLYADQADAQGNPTNEYWRWAKEGWADPKAHRYPRGKGARPLYSWWDGERLGYIEARKRIYAPLYARAVVRTQAFTELKGLLQTESRDIYLRDWDGYDHLAKEQTIAQVAANPLKKMGHAFVLWSLLTDTYEELIAPLPAAPSNPQGQLL
jgi:hypothetical protein